MRSAIALAAAALFPSGTCVAQFFNDYDQKPHNYWEVKMEDPMSALVRGVEAGEVGLPDADGLPLVRQLLKELEIPVESQVLVFSRTSLQRGAVSPSNPRAIYFNEETYLGWMPGGRIEIASCDPERGAVFFFQRTLGQEEGPRFFRDKVCLQCHAGSATNFMPGLLGRSVFPDGRGRSLRAIDSFERVGHGVPIHDRWGGWYVTGGYAGMSHMGNAIATRGAGGVQLDREANAATAGLGDRIDAESYPRGDSDIVALLVFDHQVSAQFELMQATYVARQTLTEAGWKADENPAELPPAVAEEFAGVVERVVKQLLFFDEAKLGDEVVSGAGDFQKPFLARAKRDGKGRSLRDLHLQGHMFKYRCSYMVHSGSFAGIPPIMKSRIFARLREVLEPEEAPAGYEYLPKGERKAILEILEATLEGFKGA